MKITANENGIVIKKLFKEVEIPYGSIEKIVIEDQNRTVISTRSGDEYIDASPMGITFNYPIVADKIVQLNIAFEDKWVVSDYSDTIIEEENKQEYVDSLLASFEPEASKMIKERLGERHDISLEVLEIHRDTVLCMRLLRDGVEVADYLANISIFELIDCARLIGHCHCIESVRIAIYTKVLKRAINLTENRVAISHRLIKRVVNRIRIIFV